MMTPHARLIEVRCSNAACRSSARDWKVPSRTASLSARPVGESGRFRDDVLGEQPGIRAEEVQGRRGVLADFQRHAQGTAAAVGRELALVVGPTGIGIDVREQDHGLDAQRLDARSLTEALFDAVQGDRAGAAARNRHGPLPALQRDAALDLGAGGAAQLGCRELGQAPQEVLDIVSPQEKVLEVQGSVLPDGVVGHA
jgi:hypothetical protein